MLNYLSICLYPFHSTLLCPFWILLNIDWYWQIYMRTWKFNKKNQICMLIWDFSILGIPANVVWILIENYWDDLRITFQFSQCWINFQFLKVALKIEGTHATALSSHSTENESSVFKIAAAMFLFQFYHFIGFEYVL